MSLETAAAILTKLAFEKNDDFRSKLISAKADEGTVVALIMPLYSRFLFELQEGQQAHDKFPSAIPVPHLVPDKSATVTSKP